VHGPITRTVADAALMLSVMAGVDDRAPNSLPDHDIDYVRAGSGQVPITGRRIAYTADLGGVAPVAPEVVALTRAAARQFESLGCRVDEACPDLSDLRTIVAATRAFGMVGRYAGYLESYRDHMTEPLVRQVTDSLKLDVRTITEGERRRSAYYHRMRLFLQNYDYIVCPTVGVPAFRLDCPLPTEVGGTPVDRFYDVFLFTYAFSVTGLPAISVPCGFTREGLPVGLQIVGRRLREDAVLEAAAAYLQACPQHLRRPRVDAGSLLHLPEVHTSTTMGPDWIGRSGAER
jgi:amidase